MIQALPLGWQCLHLGAFQQIAIVHNIQNEQIAIELDKKKTFQQLI